MAGLRVSIGVAGHQEMVKRLREMKNRMAARHLMKSVMPGAEIVRDAAAANAPRRQGAPRKAGHLADNIVIKVQKRGKSQAIVLVGPSADHFWGHFLEFGTAKMPAQPWLRPALENNLNAVAGAVRFELRSRLLEAIR